MVQLLYENKLVMVQLLCLQMIPTNSLTIHFLHFHLIEFDERLNFIGQNRTLKSCSKVGRASDFAYLSPLKFIFSFLGYSKNKSMFYD